MSNCEIKGGSHDGDGLEVHIYNSTEIVKSHSVFNVSKDKGAKKAVALIDTIEDLSQYQRVTVEGKVVELNKIKKVSGNLNLVVAESSESIRITIWQQMTGEVEKNKPYCFKQMMVQCSRGRNFSQPVRLTQLLTRLMMLEQSNYATEYSSRRKSVRVENQEEGQDNHHRMSHKLY